jgi:hypothetical protein
VHTDARAAAAARAVNALAYTLGHNIVFGAGQYAPETMAGRRLLAHELTHVLQQNPAHAPTQSSALPSGPAQIQTKTSHAILQRWSVNGPADASLNTIVCNGKGGIRVQLGNTGNADQTACLSDCMRRHEESHRADALASNAKLCKGKTDGSQVTFSSTAEQKASEIKASNAEINCLKGKAKKASVKCKPIIKDRITQMKGYRDSFK